MNQEINNGQEEKKKSRALILVPIVALGIFVVFVFGATFAYFAADVAGVNNVNVNVNTANATKVFSSTGTSLELNITSADMAQSVGKNDGSTYYSVDANHNGQAELDVSFLAGITENLTCTYDIAFVYDGADHYSVTNEAAAIGKQDMTYNLVSNVAQASATAANMNTEIVFPTADGIILSNAKISNDSVTTATLQHWTFTVKVYNLDVPQNGFAGKNYKGHLAVKNIVC